MIPEIEQHRAEIISICEEFGLERLELFGSAISNEFNSERSDIDFLVVFPTDFDYGPWGARETELRMRFEQLLGRNVDLVVLKWVRNPYVRRSIERNRVLLYAA
jgi:predicted nucleotidyltransferase